MLKRRLPDKPVNESHLLFVVCFTLIPKDQAAADSVDAQIPLERPLSHQDGAETAPTNLKEEKKAGDHTEFVDDDVD